MPMKGKLLVLYHGACRDGFCAAWVVHKVYPDAEFVPCYYGAPPPDCAGRPVLMVDFSYPRDVMERIMGQAERLIVLDHHVTARDALKDLRLGDLDHVMFDMERSGAGLAWDFFFTAQPRPWVVNYVEDRDLWRKRLPDTEPLNALISTYPFEFAKWDELADLNHDAPTTIRIGEAVMAKTDQYCREVAKNAQPFTFEGIPTVLVNAPQVDISELLAGLAEKNGGFAMGWWQRGDGIFQYSLRATEDRDLDVSELAKRYGGGGHKKAAGFQVAMPIHGLHPAHADVVACRTCHGARRLHAVLTDGVDYRIADAGPCPACVGAR